MTETRTLTNGKAATPARWQDAALRARREGVEVYQVNDSGMWIAASGTRAGVAYTLEVINGIVISCSCEAAEFRDPVCKHRAAWALAHGLIVIDEPAQSAMEMPS